MWGRWDLAFLEEQPEAKEKEHICDDSDHRIEGDETELSAQKNPQTEKDPEHDEKESEKSESTWVGLTQRFEPLFRSSLPHRGRGGTTFRSGPWLQGCLVPPGIRLFLKLHAL